MGNHRRLEAFVDAIMAEAPVLARSEQHRAQAPVSLHRREHLRRHRRRQQPGCAAVRGRLDTNRQPRKVARRRPQPRRSEFRVHVIAAGDDFAAGMARGHIAQDRRRRRLGKGAALHPERAEHFPFGQLVEGQAAHVAQRDLRDHIAAARVLPLLAHRQHHLDGLRVGRRGPVQHLHRGGHRRPDPIARKAVHIQARRVAEQFAQRDGLGRQLLVARQPPRCQGAVDVVVEMQFALLDQAQCGKRGDDLADRRRLEIRLGRDGRAGIGVAHAPASGPFELAVVDDSDADTGHRIGPHALLQRKGRCVRVREQQMLLDDARVRVDRATEIGLWQGAVRRGLLGKGRA